MVYLLREGRNTYATPPLLPGVCVQLIDLMLRGLSGSVSSGGLLPQGEQGTGAGSVQRLSLQTEHCMITTALLPGSALGSQKQF